VIDQVGGRLHHAAGAASGAKPSSLAAEGDQVFMKAAVALDAQKAVFQQAALQVVVEFLADEPRQVTS
jgi:hypothetical protein